MIDSSTTNIQPKNLAGIEESEPFQGAGVGSGCSFTSIMFVMVGFPVICERFPDSLLGPGSERLQM